MQLVLEDIQTPEWTKHMRPDYQRYNENLLHCNKTSEHYVHGYIHPNGDIRYVLAESSNLKKTEGLTTLTGRICSDNKFYMTGCFTPKEHRRNGYAKKLLLEVVRIQRVVHGDNQNTREGAALMDSAGRDSSVKYYRPQTIIQEAYLSQLEDGDLSSKEKEALFNRAHDTARLEVK